jgi:hypothetical protein
MTSQQNYSSTKLFVNKMTHQQNDLSRESVLNKLTCQQNDLASVDQREVDCRTKHFFKPNNLTKRTILTSSK